MSEHEHIILQTNDGLEIEIICHGIPPSIIKRPLRDSRMAVIEHEMGGIIPDGIEAPYRERIYERIGEVHGRLLYREVNPRQAKLFI